MTHWNEFSAGWLVRYAVTFTSISLGTRHVQKIMSSPFHLFLFAVSLNFTLAFLPIQSIPADQVSRGSCAPFNFTLLGGSDGLIANVVLGLNLHSTDSITVLGAKITCESLGLRKDTFSSVTVVAEFVCAAPACTSQPIVQEFTFFCEKTSNRYVPLNSVVRPELSVSSARSTRQGKCGTCSSDSREDSGCVGMQN
jgi:hypothetical protein